MKSNTYVNKLKKLGVYKQWKTNTRNFGNDEKELCERCEARNDDFQDLVLCSFVFSNTPEGHDFWYQVSMGIKPVKVC